MKPFQHGTRSMYCNGKCRCELCKDANRRYMKAWLPGYTKRRLKLSAAALTTNEETKC